MFRTKKRSKKIEDICKSYLIRKATKIYKDKLYIDENIYDIETIKIKNKIHFITEVSPIQNWKNNRIYLIEKANSIDLTSLKSEVDIIECDIKFNILCFHKKIKRNSNIKWNEKTFNIWISKTGFIDFYNIKNNGYIALKTYSL